MSILVDSNIIIYTHNKDSPFYKKARNFLDSLLRRKKVYFAFQNLLESYSILTSIRILEKNKALEIIKFYFYHPNSIILYPTNKTAAILFQLLNKYQIMGERTYDFHLIALMIENHLETIYSKNTKDFQKIKEIKVIDPC
jgi:predicted nucleic acid-binding protein